MTRLISNFIVPYIICFALYVQLNGEASPGGGFQAGVIFASINILRSFFGHEINQKYYYIAAVSGVIGYILLGVIEMMMGGNYLDHNKIFIDSKHIAQGVGIMIIEFCIGLTISSSMSLMYFLFKEE